MADPLAWEGKGKLIMIFQDVHAVSDCLDLCKFSAFAEGAGRVRGAVRGDDRRAMTAGDLLTAGERIYNLERYYNNLDGFREGSDYLPKRFLKNPRRCLARRATSASWT